MNGDDTVFGQFSTVAIGLVLLSLLLFAGTLGNGFVLDDMLLIRDDPRLLDPSQTLELLTTDYWSPHRTSGLYRPLVKVSYAMNAWIFGLEPASYHGVNVLLHALSAVMVFGIFARLTHDRALSLGGALLFVTHAVHSEAVANVAGRAELLCATFFLGAVWTYLVCLARKVGHRGRSYALCLLLFGLALFCKENALTFIGVAVLCDWTHGLVQGRVRGPGQGPVEGRSSAPTTRRGSPHPRRELVLRYAGIVSVAAVCFGVRYLVLPGEGSMPEPSRLDNPLITLDAPLRIANALMILQRYVGLLLFPIQLTYDYSYAQIPLASSLTDPRLVLATVLTAAELGVALWLLRRSAFAFFGAAFFFVTMSVVANVIVPIGTIMAERLLYLPSVGFCLLAAVGIRAATRRLPLPQPRQGVLFAVAIAVLATLHGAQAAARSADWGSQDRLYLVDLAKSPQSARVQSNAGFIAQERGEHRRALRFFARALQIEPRSEKAYVNAGVSYAALGEWEKAIEVFGVAVDLQPWKASLHWKLAESLIAAARTEEALPHLEAAARLAPDDEEVRNALASAYEGMGHPDWAQALYRESDPRKTKPPGGAR